jgi:hypothetical protein
MATGAIFEPAHVPATQAKSARAGDGGGALAVQ